MATVAINASLTIANTNTNVEVYTAAIKALMTVATAVITVTKLAMTAKNTVATAAITATITVVNTITSAEAHTDKIIALITSAPAAITLVMAAITVATSATRAGQSLRQQRKLHPQLLFEKVYLTKW